MLVSITKAEVLSLSKCLNDIVSSNGQLPTKLLYAIGKNRGKLQTIINSIDNDRMGLVKKHGDKSENGMIEVTKDNIQQFSDDYTDLLNDVEKLELHTIPYVELEVLMPTMKGVDNINLFFDYVVSDAVAKELKAELS